MFDSLKKEWQHLKKGKPGCRFQDHRRRVSKRRRHPAVRWVRIALSFVIFAVGLLAIPAPGPGWLIVIFGLGMLASEIMIVAKMLDSAEVKLRAFGQWCKHAWQRATPLMRAGVVTIGVALAGGAGWMMYRVIVD